MDHHTGSPAATQPKRDAADRPFSLTDGSAVDPRKPWPFRQISATQMRADRAGRREAQAQFLAKLDEAWL